MVDASAWPGPSAQAFTQTVVSVLLRHFTAEVHLYHQLTRSEEDGSHPIS